MPTTLVPPDGVSQTSFNGETYIVGIDGNISVPDGAVEVLCNSHGFRKVGSPDPGVIIRGFADTVADDDEELLSDDALPPSMPKEPTPEEFSARLSQAEMKAFLRSNGVTPPVHGKVRDMRVLVEETYSIITAPIKQSAKPDDDKVKPADDKGKNPSKQA